MDELCLASKEGMDEPCLASKEGMDEPCLASKEGMDEPCLDSKEGMDEPCLASKEGRDEPGLASKEGTDEPCLASQLQDRKNSVAPLSPIAEEGGATLTYVTMPVEPVATPVPPVLSLQKQTHILSIGEDDTVPPLPVVTDKEIWLPTRQESHHEDVAVSYTHLTLPTNREV